MSMNDRSTSYETREAMYQEFLPSLDSLGLIGAILKKGIKIPSIPDLQSFKPKIDPSKN